jgi:hypothetical protein
MYKRSFPAGAMLLVTVFLLTSCAYGPDVVGRWQRVDGPETLEFREDGTFTTVDNMKATAVGLYTLHADGTLYYAVTHTDILQAELRPVEIFEVRIAGVKFRPHRYELAVMTDAPAEAAIYRRVD